MARGVPLAIYLHLVHTWPRLALDSALYPPAINLTVPPITSSVVSTRPSRLAQALQLSRVALLGLEYHVDGVEYVDGVESIDLMVSQLRRTRINPGQTCGTRGRTRELDGLNAQII